MGNKYPVEFMEMVREIYVIRDPEKVAELLASHKWVVGSMDHDDKDVWTYSLYRIARR